MPRAMRIGTWVLQVVAAAILAQTLFFKFAGAPEAKWIFTTLGVEPWGRIGLGVVELVAVVLLLVPRTAAVGAGLAAGLMGGAIFSHVTKLGVQVPHADGTLDGGTLFGLAIVVLACSLGVLYVRRGELPVVGPRLQRMQAIG